MPKPKKDTDSSARIPTPSIDLDDPSSDDSPSDRETPENHGTNEPANQRASGPENQRSGEPQNQRTEEPTNRRTAEDQSEARSRDSAVPSSTGDPSASDGFADAPLTYESMITPTAPINRKKIGVHIDEVTFDASSEAWREMLRIDNNLNKGVVVEAALRVALADFAEKGSESSLWKMVEQICRTEA